MTSLEVPPILYFDRDRDLWSLGDDGVLRVFHRTLHQWIPSHRTPREVELDYGPLTPIPWPTPATT